MKRALAIMLVALIAATTVFAQGLQEGNSSFPDPERTITIIVPQGAGGGTDTFARALAAKMTEVSGQNFIVENITGNSTGTGTNDVINSEPDGYKMLMYGTYTIVGTIEANPLKGLVSNISPLGKAVIGKRVGDVCVVKVPNEYKVEILKIETK